ncbi:MAG: FUSC family protein [Hyphomicrobiales bacterium]|nr:FUSC family protein [Hyphomicrobiales bacterium]
MTSNGYRRPGGSGWWPIVAIAWTDRLRAAGQALRDWAPALLFGLRLWASVSLALYVAFWIQLDEPYWAGTSAAIVCQPQLGASLRKGWYRLIGTMIGAAMSVLLVACFTQDRVLFLAALAAWAAACAFASTILRNFGSYSAVLAGITVAIVGGDLLGPAGGLDANSAFLFAVSRASEVCLGIVCAGFVLAGTDLGGAPRRLATLFADLSADITADFAHTLSTAARDFDEMTPVRRQFVQRIVALDPVIDQTLGESSQIRYYSPVLQSAVDGLFTACSGWRAIANHLHRLPSAQAQQDVAAVFETVPPELRAAPQPGASNPWLGEPVALHGICELTVRRLIALPAATPSVRLLADKAAEALDGIAHALNGLALLAADPARPVSRRGVKRLRVPDWLPAFINAGRAFVAIGAVALFWIVTGWPGGGGAITFASIVVLLFAPRAEQAYGLARSFMLGIATGLAIAAIVKFAILPALGVETFVGFSVVLAGCFVPIGALLLRARKPWQVGAFTGMASLFTSLLQPTNPMTYDIQAFYNYASAIVFGCGFGALSFSLLPSLSPAYRSRRLLALTLRDLRRFASGRPCHDWEGMVRGRLSAMPNEATPLQRAQMLAALSAGSEIVRLRPAARHLGFGPQIGAALAALAEGDSARAIDRLSRLEQSLAADAADTPMQTVLRSRASIVVLSEALAKHAVYFDGEARA